MPGKPQKPQQKQQQKPRAAQQPAGPERRIDATDGNPYTKQEFVDLYRGTAEWDRSRPEHVPPPVGARVEAHGLSRRPELNGQRGTVVAHKTHGDIQAAGAEIPLRASNLRELPASPPCSETSTPAAESSPQQESPPPAPAGRTASALSRKSAAEGAIRPRAVSTASREGAGGAAAPEGAPDAPAEQQAAGPRAGELAAALERLAEREAEIEGLRAAAEEAAAGMAEASRRCQGLQVRERQLEEDLRRKSNHNQELQAELQAAQQEVQRLQQSLSVAERQGEALGAEVAKCAAALGIAHPGAAAEEGEHGVVDGPRLSALQAAREMRRQMDELREANWRLQREAGEMRRRAAGSSRLKQPPAQAAEGQPSPALEQALRQQRQAEQQVSRLTAELHRERQAHEETKLLRFEADEALAELRRRHRERQQAAVQTARALERRLRAAECGGGARPPFRVAPSPSVPSRSVTGDAAWGAEGGDAGWAAAEAVGSRVSVLRQGAGLFLGTVRYCGQCDFAPGVWVGVELDGEDGRHDGAVHGRRYFTCPPARGIFVRPEAVASEAAQCSRCRAAPPCSAHPPLRVPSPSARAVARQQAEVRYLRLSVELRERLSDEQEQVAALRGRLAAESQARERLQAALAHAQAQLAPASLRWGSRRDGSPFTFRGFAEEAWRAAAPWPRRPARSPHSARASDADSPQRGPCPAPPAPPRRPGAARRSFSSPAAPFAPLDEPPAPPPPPLPPQQPQPREQPREQKQPREQSEERPPPDPAEAAVSSLAPSEETDSASADVRLQVLARVAELQDRIISEW
eukprot:TRINITY_DN3375_c1_g1_i1.p1 TRINITY_DN3375_c1_g1~~TRINITY_DN3375_c1_g1_i1.p1  ORF type:complete len:832 (+),score=275.72 TRINITY_DN3375_c1_g1_i1:84-2498(+)